MGSGAEKRAGLGEVRCVAGTAPALLQSGVRGHHFRIIINKYKQSDWFSRFLVMLSQQARAKYARPLSDVKAGSGNETIELLVSFPDPAFKLDKGLAHFARNLGLPDLAVM